MIPMEMGDENSLNWFFVIFRHLFIVFRMKITLQIFFHTCTLFVVSKPSAIIYKCCFFCAIGKSFGVKAALAYWMNNTCYFHSPIILLEVLFYLRICCKPTHNSNCLMVNNLMLCLIFNREDIGPKNLRAGDSCCESLRRRRRRGCGRKRCRYR